MSAFAIYGKVSNPVKGSGKKATPVKLSVASTMPKSDWDPYLTDLNRFKLPEEKFLMKKKQLISKNNFLHGEGDKRKVDLSTPAKPNPKHASRTPEDKTPQEKAILHGSEVDYDYSNRSSDIMDLTALDILDSSEDDSADDDSHKSGQNHGGHVRDRKRIQKQGELAFRQHTNHQQSKKGSSGNKTATTSHTPSRLQKPSSIRSESKPVAPPKANVGHKDNKIAVSRLSPNAVTPLPRAYSLVSSPSPTSTPMRGVVNPSQLNEYVETLSTIIEGDKMTVKSRQEANIEHHNLLQSRHRTIGFNEQFSSSSISEIAAQVRMLLGEMRDYEMLTEKTDQAATNVRCSLYNISSFIYECKYSCGYIIPYTGFRSCP